MMSENSWKSKPWPELNADSHLEPNKFYIQLYIENIGPAGYGTDQTGTYIFDDVQDFMRLLKYLLIPNLLDYEIDMEPIEAGLNRIRSEIDAVLSSDKKPSKKYLQSFVFSFNDLFQEFNPTYKILAYGELQEYTTTLFKQNDNEIEKPEELRGILKKKSFAKKDLNIIKDFLLSLTREP
jgi:hypothetical protein